MKKIILALMLIISTTGNAKFRQIVNIKYQTDYGWSKYYNVEVTFMMGYELNMATRSYDYSSYNMYGVVFWRSGQATVIKLNYITCGYEATPRCISGYYQMDGTDQDGDNWYFCLSRYCY
jgi:hypothetical protein